MRLSALIFALGTSIAQAADCEAPKQQGNTLVGLGRFAACLNSAMSELEAENARLREELEKIQASLPDFPGTLVNENGRVTRTGGNQLLQASFAAKVRRREAAQSLPIDQAALEQLCSVGCTVSMFLISEGLRTNDPTPVIASGTCTLRYSAKDGAWSQGGGCGEPTSGVDGDGKPPAQSGGDVIAAVGGACLLADSQAARAVGAEGGLLGQDRAKGLYLISEPSLWRGDTERFRCELKLSQ